MDLIKALCIAAALIAACIAIPMALAILAWIIAFAVILLVAWILIRAYRGGTPRGRD